MRNGWKDLGNNNSGRSENVYFQRKHISWYKQIIIVVVVFKISFLNNAWRLGSKRNESESGCFPVCLCPQASSGTRLMHQLSSKQLTWGSSFCTCWLIHFFFPRIAYIELQGSIETAERSLRLQQCFLTFSGLNSLQGKQKHFLIKSQGHIHIFR